MAAVLACGDGAALFGASAAALWGIRRSDAARIHVVVPTDAGRATRPAIRVHRIRTLRRVEVTVEDGIRVTTPAAPSSTSRRRSRSTASAGPSTAPRSSS
jgi:hypothetical protein